MGHVANFYSAFYGYFSWQCLHPRIERGGSWFIHVQTVLIYVSAIEATWRLNNKRKNKQRLGKNILTHFKACCEHTKSRPNSILAGYLLIVFVFISPWQCFWFGFFSSLSCFRSASERTFFVRGRARSKREEKK